MSQLGRIGGVEFSCCFCADPIAKHQRVGVTVSDTNDQEVWQQWWAHKGCFKSALYPTYIHEIREEFE